MGLGLWKLNNTGNRIDFSGHQCSYDLQITDVFWESADIHLDEEG